MTTSENIIGNAVATQHHLAKIEASLFEVVKVPLTPLDMPSFFKAPKDAFGHYKSNGGECIGKVGKDSTAMQPKEFFDNILSTVHEFGADLDLNTLKFKEWCGSSKIEFSIKMHPISFKNDKGLDDITNLEVTFSTSYDASKSNVISLYTERLVCINGMVANKLQGTLKGRNTIGGKAKILSYASELAQIINGANEFKEKLIALDKIKLNASQIEAFKKSLLGYNKNSLLTSEKPETKKYNILEKVEQSIQLEFERTGQTAFGLLNGITHYNQHIANTSKKYSNEEYIRFNAGFKMNSVAQDLLFALID